MRPSAETHPPWTLGWSVGLWSVLFLWCLRPVWSIDIFFHLAIGERALAGGLTGTDVFSAAHPEAAWVPFQLGYEWLVAWIHRWGGMDALRVIHAAALAAALVVTGRRFGQMARPVAASVTLGVLLLVLFEARIRLRPHVFNVLLEGLFLLPIASGRLRLTTWRSRLGVLALAWVWSLLHAMGALWLVAVVGTRVMAGETRAARQQASIALLCALLGVALAPGALEGIAHVLAIQGQWNAFVPELWPSWTWFSHGSLLGVLSGLVPWLAVAGVVAAVGAGPDRGRWPTILAAAGFAFGSVWMVRLGYYGVFALALVWPELRGVLGGRLSTTTWRRLAVTSCVALLAINVVHVVPRFAAANPWTTTYQPGHFPQEEVRLMSEAQIHGRIFNEAEWGGYLLHHLHPPSTVLSDGRITFAPDVARLLMDDRVAQKRPAVARAVKERYGVDLMLRRRGVFPERAGWELLLRGPTADIWSAPGPIFEARKRALGQILGADGAP